MKFIKNLDSLRTLAFAGTFLAHAFYSEDEKILSNSWYKGINDLSFLFSFGVPIFFVLSGFLISLLLFHELEKTGKIHLGSFYMRRILRIWPIYFLVLLIGFVIFPMVKMALIGEGVNENASPLYYITFLSNFDQIFQNQLPTGIGLGPTWSVSIEEQFYLIWPILFLFFRKNKTIFGILLILILSFSISTLFQFPIKQSVFCFFYLASGGGIAYLYFNFKEKCEHLMKRVKPYYILILLTLAITMFLSTHVQNKMLVHWFISFGLAFLVLHQATNTNFRLSRIPFIERIGKYTYGMYLYHTIANFIIYAIFMYLCKCKETLVLALIVRPILSLILTFIISYISYRFIERRILSLKRFFIPY